MQAVGEKNGNIESVYLTGDMILFHVIDLLCHLFPSFFLSYVVRRRQLVWYMNLEFIFPSIPLGSLQCNEQWVLFLAGLRQILMFLTY